MQIIIDIPSAMYNEIKSGKDGYSNYVHGAVRIGTPLPKHGRLIDADALNLYNISPSLDEELSVFGVTAEDIDLAPTLIEADDADKEI